MKSNTFSYHLNGQVNTTSGYNHLQHKNQITNRCLTSIVNRPTSHREPPHLASWTAPPQHREPPPSASWTAPPQPRKPPHRSIVNRPAAASWNAPPQHREPPHCRATSILTTPASMATLRYITKYLWLLSYMTYSIYNIWNKQHDWHGHVVYFIYSSAT